MKLNRRSFIKVVPVGVALIVASLLFLDRQTPSLSQSASSTQADFPVTWNGDFAPNVNPSDYRLRVDGDVSNPLELTIDMLQAMPTVINDSTIVCVEGWRASVKWEGIPLSHLLTLAGAPNNFDHVTVESVTGYNVDINQHDAMYGGTMIALKVGSVPLTVEHGYPARLVLPTRRGLEWVKCVGEVACWKAQENLDLGASAARNGIRTNLA